MPAYSALSISSIFIRNICLCLRATTLFPCNFYRIGFRYKVHSMAGHYSWSRCSERNELFRLNRRLHGRRAAFVRGKWKTESVKRSGMQTRKDSRRTESLVALAPSPFGYVRDGSAVAFRQITNHLRDRTRQTYRSTVRIPETSHPGVPRLPIDGIFHFIRTCYLHKRHSSIRSSSIYWVGN